MTRILPREEWHRLDQTARDLGESLNPEDVKVVVVERDGKILARVSVMRIPQLECLWVSPEAYGNAGVSRALIRAALAEAGEWAKSWVVVNADNDAMCQTIERIGGHYLKVHKYMLALPRETEEVHAG